VAEQFINKIKNEIVSNIPKKPVEEFTPEFIAHLQEQKIPVLGITRKQLSTAYADNFGQITSNHLNSIGINLEATLSYLNVKENNDNSPFSFAYGLIFTNTRAVGPILLDFLNRLENQPAKIIMIDNSYDSLKNAEVALSGSDITFD